MKHSAAWIAQAEAQFTLRKIIGDDIKSLLLEDPILLLEDPTEDHT